MSRRYGTEGQKCDSQLRADLLGLRSWLAIQQGAFQNAVRLSEEALLHLRETESVWRGIVAVFLGQALFGDGRSAEAIAAYEEALQTNDEASNWTAIGHAIGMTLALRGHLNEALFQLDKFIAMLMAMGQEPATTGSSTLYSFRTKCSCKS